MITLNAKADGYRGIWYSNGGKNQHGHIYYSGGLGTYCAKHRPFAVYSAAADKTFFCYGGTSHSGSLLHTVSYYDHKTGMVPRPTILLDKQTGDAHDNPVIALDEKGHIWIFSSSHGTERPSYIHRSIAPYDVDAFELVTTTNFSYPQVWHVPGKGFVFFHTRYEDDGRSSWFMTSRDGVEWTRQQRIARIAWGHYQVSLANGDVAGTAFNYHPPDTKLNGRTQLYYMETRDLGQSWQNVGGQSLEMPLREVNNPALVRDYESEGLSVYMKDLRYDRDGNPVILHLTTRGHAAGSENGPRTWRIAHGVGGSWAFKDVTTSENNFDMGELHLDEEQGVWRLIAPTEPGPRRWMTGGEVVLWLSRDRGKSWSKEKQLTSGSTRNHTYVRRPVDARPDFVGFWADGDCNAPSRSRLYICDADGNVKSLPESMDSEFALPSQL